MTYEGSTVYKNMASSLVVEDLNHFGIITWKNPEIFF
jgi:hypothetical protein